MDWIDHHCHLPDSGAAEVLAEAAEAGVVGVVDVGTDLPHSVAAAARARAYEGVWATAGVHPHDADGGTDGIRDLLDHPEVVAVGECGLDYHYDRSERACQREVFARQVRWAHETSLPLVIHTREAWEDTFAVLDAEGLPARTVFHCFTGGPAEAESCLERGAYLSVSGIVTFGSAGDLRDAVARAPLDRLLVETDSPYLAPRPHRGKPNRPAWVPVVGAAVAELHGVEVAEVARLTLATTRSFYDVGPAVDDGGGAR